MDITDLISSDAIIPTLRAPSKKQALQELARLEEALEGDGAPPRTDWFQAAWK